MNVMNNPPKRSPWRLALLFVLWMVFGIALIQSLVVAVAWWQGGFQGLGTAETVWAVLFPVLLLIYIWRFTIFRPGCTSCVASEHDDARHVSRGP